MLKYQADLREKEKVITNLILNNEEARQNEKLMHSFNKSLLYNQEEGLFDFKQVIGRVNSNTDELMERERVI